VPLPRLPRLLPSLEDVLTVLVVYWLLFRSED